MAESKQIKLRMVRKLEASEVEKLAEYHNLLSDLRKERGNEKQIIYYEDLIEEYYINFNVDVMNVAGPKETRPGNGNPQSNQVPKEIKDTRCETIVENMEYRPSEDDPIYLLSLNQKHWELFYEVLLGLKNNNLEIIDTLIKGWDHLLLREVILAANYLAHENIKKLLLKKLAERVKGKSIDDMRKILGLKDDLTEEKRAEIAKKLAWIDKLEKE